MRVHVAFTDSPATVLDEAGAFLAERPVRHNLILALLRARVTTPEPGRYWTAWWDDGTVAGLAFQSPLDFAATLTPMPPEAVAALVESIADRGVALPGVSGEADVASRFAGAWTERTGTAALPTMGLRLYELERAVPPTGVSGALRPATAADHDVLVAWVRAFEDETHDVRTADIPAAVGRRLAAGELWLWDDGGPVSMAALTEPVAAVARVQLVYTPAHRRQRGYATASVAALSQQVLDAGLRPVLYTDLGNPTSNRIYRAIGYRAVAECLKYRFV